MALDLDTLWETKLQPEFERLNTKVDKINGKTQENTLTGQKNWLHTKAQWYILGIVGSLAGWWIRCLIKG